MAKIPDNIVYIMAVDNAGNVVNIDADLLQGVVKETTIIKETAPVQVQQKPKKQKAVTPTEEEIQVFKFNADPNYIPIINYEQDNLENSIIFQKSKSLGVNTKNPQYLIDIYNGSINIDTTDDEQGIYINKYNLAQFLTTDENTPTYTIILGDDTNVQKVSLYDLIIRSLILEGAAQLSQDRILMIDNDGLVTAIENLYSINGLVDRTQVFATGTSGTDFNISSVTDTHTFNFPDSSASNRGLLTSTDWSTFNNKQDALTLNNLTESTSNILTITGGTNSVIGSGTTIQVKQASGIQSGYLSSTDWTTFNNKQPLLTNPVTGTGTENTLAKFTSNGSTIGDSHITENATNIFLGLATNVTGDLNISTGSQFQINGVRINTDDIPEDASPTNKYFTEARTRGTVLTGLSTGTGGTIAATDTILQAFGKIQNQIDSFSGSASYQGTWNASTNTPTITSGVGTDGYYYIVSVAGTTTVDGISSWAVGDWIIFNGTTWEKISYNVVTSVNTKTGAVTLYTDDISEDASPINLWYTNARVAAYLNGAISTVLTSNLTADRALVSNASGKVVVSAITSTELSYLDNVTSNIQTQLNGKAATSHTHTLNQITDITATATEVNYTDGVTSNIQTQLNNRSLTTHNHTLDSLSNVTITSNSSGEILKWNGTAWINNTLAEAGIQPSGSYLTTSTSFGGDVSGTYNNIVIADDSHNHIISNIDGLQTALDGKQGTLTLTTTNTSGASTLVGSTLNIPQYQGALTLTTTGTSGAATLVGTTLNIPQYQGGVTSFNSRTGAVSPAEGDYDLTELGDVSISSLATNHILQYNGTQWVNAAITTSQTLQDVTDNGNTTSNNISITNTSDVASTGFTLISSAIQTSGGARIGKRLHVASTQDYDPNTFASIHTLGGAYITKRTVIGDTTEGSSSPTGALMVYGGAYFAKKVYAAGYYENSDIRYKDIIDNNPFVDLSSLSPIKYTFKEDDSKTIRYGYSAQEVRHLDENLTREDENGKLSVNYTDIHTMKIAQLEKKIAELEKLIANK